MRAGEISARKLRALAQASNGERKRSVQPRKARGQRAQADGRARGKIKKIKHMKRIRLDKRRKRVNVDGFEMENEVVYNYFAGLPEREREEKFFKAIYIGVLALMEDRLSAFLAKTSNELGTELESLKMIFDMKREIFYKSAVKGSMAENDILEFLKGHLAERGINDVCELTGTTAGKLPKNKTGDIVCRIDGAPDKRIVIECKFDKSIRLGDISERDVFRGNSDTAWSQLLEAQLNRDAQASIIAIDAALADPALERKVDGISYIPGVGFVAIVDSQRGDYSNLAAAYSLARDIAKNAGTPQFDKDAFRIMLTRILRDMRAILETRKLAETIIAGGRELLKRLEQGLLLLEHDQKYFLKLLQNGSLSKGELLEFYLGDEPKEKFAERERQIDSL